MQRGSGGNNRRKHHTSRRSIRFDNRRHTSKLMLEAVDPLSRIEKGNALPRTFVPTERARRFGIGTDSCEFDSFQKQQSQSTHSGFALFLRSVCHAFFSSKSYEESSRRRGSVFFPSSDSDTRTVAINRTCCCCCCCVDARTFNTFSKCTHPCRLGIGF